MAPLSSVAGALLLALVLAHVDLSTCLLLKGMVTCTDCRPDHDLSEVQVSVRCSNERRLTSALTNKEGYFEVEIPTNSSLPSAQPQPKCSATLVGGAEQLFALRKSMVSKVVKARGGAGSGGFCTLASPLTFFTSRPSDNGQHVHPGVEKMASHDDGGSSGLFPGGWALPPSYFRFLPIIGIP